MVQRTSEEQTSPPTSFFPISLDHMLRSMSTTLMKLPYWLAYHCWTAFLFTKSDIKTTLIPIVRFTVYKLSILRSNTSIHFRHASPLPLLRCIHSLVFYPPCSGFGYNSSSLTSQTKLSTPKKTSVINQIARFPQIESHYAMLWFFGGPYLLFASRGAPAIVKKSCWQVLLTASWHTYTMRWDTLPDIGQGETLLMHLVLQVSKSEHAWLLVSKTNPTLCY